MTKRVGRVEWVGTEDARSFLSSAASISDSTLNVENGEIFAVDAGSLPGSIQLPDGSIVTYDDWTATTLELTDPLLVAIDEGDPIAVYPERAIKWAGVNFAPDGEWSETVPCRVPHGSQWFTRLEDGIFEDDDRPVVTVDLTTSPVLVDLDNEVAMYDGSYLDPDSTIPPGALTDGDPPSGSPTPDLEPFGVGGLRWSVTPVPNADPVRFRIYADTVDPPTIDAAHLVADTGSLSGSFARVNGEALLPANPADPIVPFYVAAIEYDADGDATVSATSLPSEPRRATVPDIAAEWIYGNSIEANQITAGTFEADLAMLANLAVGRYIDIDGDSSSITIYADEDHLEPLVQLRPEGSVFRGQVIADDVSVLNGLILQGTASHVAPSAGVTLDSVIQDPGVGPTLTMTPETQAWPAIPAGYTQAGFCWDATLDGGSGGWLRLIKKSTYATGTSKVQRIYGSPLAVQSEVTLSGGGEDQIHSITRLGSNYFTMGPATPGAYFKVYKWSTAGAYVAKSSAQWSTDFGSPAVGNDGTDLLVAEAIATLIDAVDPSTLALGAGYTTSGIIDSTTVGFVGRGNFDFGADRFVVGRTNGQISVFSYSGGFLVEETDKAFTGRGWLAWDGSRFFGSTTGILDRYSSHYPSASQKAYVSYADTDTGSSKHTKDSPISEIALTARRFVQAVLPPAPVGATTPRVYAALGTSSPPDTALLKRAETVTNRVVLIDPAVAGGAALVRTATVTNKALTSNVATLTTSAAHGLEVGDSITVAGVDATFNGTFTITAVGSSTTLSYAKVAANVGSTASGGSVTNTDSNTFGSGTPGWIKSQTGGLELHGDGTVKVGGINVAGDSWQSPTFNGTWTNFGSPYDNVAYRKIPGRIEFRGVAKHATTSTTGTVFTLLSGFRPSSTKRLSIGASGGDAVLTIDSSGVVSIAGYVGSGNAAAINFDEVWFPV